MIHRGANGGYQAINLAVSFGAQRIFLLGYDMGLSVSGARHWFGDHPKGLNNPQADDFERWCGNFATMLPDLHKVGVDVINCSRETRLDCFERMSMGQMKWT